MQLSHLRLATQRFPQDFFAVSVDHGAISVLHQGRRLVGVACARISVRWHRLFAALLAGGGMDSSVPSARIEADGGQQRVTSQMLTGAVLTRGLADTLC